MDLGTSSNRILDGEEAGRPKCRMPCFLVAGLAFRELLCR